MRSPGCFVVATAFAGTLAAWPAAAERIVAHALVSQPSLPSYTVDPAEARNDGGGAVRVTRSAPGVYRVIFEGLATAAPPGGHVQVTALGPAPAGCKVQSWGAGTVNVRCFDRAGRPADARFGVLFLAADVADADLAYAWANGPSTASYVPSPTYSHNPGGAEIRATRRAVGRYSVRFAGWSGRTGGNVQVTAYGSGSERCQVEGWSLDRVEVACAHADGRAADTRFTLLMLRPAGQPAGLGFAWADQPASGDYAPRSTYAYNGAGGAMRARRQAVGRYTLEFEGLRGTGGQLQVTAYGSVDASCQLDDAASSPGAWTAGVRCFNAAGQPADTRYALLAWAGAAGAGGGSGGGGTPGAATRIDFEDLARGARVTTQYAARGARFLGAYLDEDRNASSGSRVLRSDNPTREFDTGPLVIEFSAAQSRVAFQCGERFTGVRGTLQAFDADGRLLDTDGPKAVSTGAFTTRFEVKATPARIRRVVLQHTGTAFESIDDLEFEGEGAGELPTDAPVVAVTSPADYAELTSAQITLAGSVTGEALLSPARIEVSVARPPGSNAPATSTGSLALAGTGTSRTFTQTRTLELGPQTITVSVENAGGLRASASAHVAWFPQAIRGRMASEGLGRLGAFVFGGHSGGCDYAVFERAAVALREGRTFVVRGAILEKWLNDAPSNGYPTLGCPTSEERVVEGDTARAQDFERARLYADDAGAFKVPTIFVRALDAFGGEAGIGIPVEEPRQALAGSVRTELFQRFRRPGKTEPAATLEIRTTQGVPTPRLYVERKNNYPGTDVLWPGSPTIVHEFACADLGRCDVTLPQEAFEPDLGRFCSHETFNWEAVKDAALGVIGVDDMDLDPPEWVAIAGHHVQTPARGIIVSAENSSGDNPFTHEWRNNCSLDNPLSEALDCFRWFQGYGEPLCCPSDMHINVEMLPGYRKLIGTGTGVDAGYRDKGLIAVEYERGHARAFTAFGADPHVGDLLFVSGRWIVDCGHNYKTEIHPPSVLAFMRGSTYEDKPATFALVWVNGFYSGEPVDIAIHPPPRPSPTATLRAVKEGTDASDITITDTIVDSQYLRLRISAPPRRVPVTAAGEMKWDTGRDYKGRLRVFWDE